MPISMRSVMVFAVSLVLALAAGTARGAVPACSNAECAALKSMRLLAPVDAASVRLVEEDVDDEGENDNDDGEENRRSELGTPSAATPSSATLFADADGDDDDSDEDEDEDLRVAAPGPLGA